MLESLASNYLQAVNKHFSNVGLSIRCLDLGNIHFRYAKRGGKCLNLRKGACGEGGSPETAFLISESAFAYKLCLAFYKIIPITKSELVNIMF